MPNTQGRIPFVQTDAPPKPNPVTLRVAEEVRVKEAAAVSDVEEIIRALYRNILGREADPVGLAHYVRGFMAGASIDLISEYLRSSEEAGPRDAHQGGWSDEIRLSTTIEHVIPPTAYFSFATAHTNYFCRNIVANTVTRTNDHHAKIRN